MTHSVTSILTQIRSYQTQVGQVAGPVAETPRTDAIPTRIDGAAAVLPSFTETLRGAMSAVNESQQVAGALRTDFELGKPGADLAKVMVAAQESQIAFRATVEVRNRLVQAYQDVMNMPL